MVVKAKHDQELQQYLQAKEWKKVVISCQDYELEADFQNPPNYSIHLLAYLILGDLVNARFLWKRIPEIIKKSVPILGDIWTVGKHMWNKNYPEVYKALNSNWDNFHQPLIVSLLESFRARNFELLSRAYTTISLDDASVYLGLSPNDTTTYVTQRGWVFDSTSNGFKVAPLPDEKSQKVSLRQLDQLTEYFCYLEQQ